MILNPPAPCGPPGCEGKFASCILLVLIASYIIEVLVSLVVCILESFSLVSLEIVTSSFLIGAPTAFSFYHPMGIFPPVWGPDSASPLANPAWYLHHSQL